MPHILAEISGERLHRQRLSQLLAETGGLVRIASAYVTERELHLRTKGRSIRLMTALAPMDIASGATSLEALRAIIEAGFTIKVLPENPRLHAKVYIFGTSAAVITSANLTKNALDSNIEVGVEIAGKELRKLIE